MSDFLICEGKPVTIPEAVVILQGNVTELLADMRQCYQTLPHVSAFLEVRKSFRLAEIGLLTILDSIADGNVPASDKLLEYIVQSSSVNQWYHEVLDKMIES